MRIATVARAIRVILSAIVFPALLAILIAFLWYCVSPDLAMRRAATEVEAQMVGFTFNPDPTGVITVRYQLNGKTYESQLSGSFSEFQREKRVSILVNEDFPTQGSWKSPLRFWLFEIFLFIIWCSFVFVWIQRLIPAFYQHRRAHAGVTVIIVSIMALVCIIYPYQSIRAFGAVASPVIAKVEAVTEDICTRTNSDDEFQEYRCYKPTYAYTVAQDTYRLEASEFYKRRPAIGEEKELWYWKEGPEVVRESDPQSRHVEVILVTILVVGHFIFGVYLLVFHRLPEEQ